MAKKIIVDSKDLSSEEIETKTILEENGKPVYYMPIEITNQEQLETLGITRQQCRTWRFGAEWKTVHLTPCSEEVFTVLSRDLWLQQTQEYRNNRCMVPGKQKPLIRCPEKNKCDSCPFGKSPWKRQPNIISVDGLMEIGREPESTESAEQLVFQRMELLEIKVKMDEKDKRLFEIFVMVNLQDYKKNDIAAKYNISAKTVRKLINEMNEIIQQIREAQE